MADVNRLTEPSSDDTHNAARRSVAPVSFEPALSATRASRSRHISPNAAPPATRTFFDPWNSSSTGHQRAENRLSGSTSWRASRNLKLSEQYNGGPGGGKRLADTVGAGSKDFGKDGRKENGGWERGAKGLRTGGQRSLIEAWGTTKTGKKASHDKTNGAGEVSLEVPLSQTDPCGDREEGTRITTLFARRLYARCEHTSYAQRIPLH